MRTRLTHLLAALVITTGSLALTPAGWAQQAPAGQKTEAGTNTESVLRYDYKPHFTTPIKAPISGSWMNGIQCGAVKVETNDYYAKPNALRLDCSVFTSSILVVSFRIPSLSAYKGKPLVFRSQVKYLKGSGALRLNMACWGSGKTIKSSTSFQGEKGKWQPFEFHGTIPELDSVRTVVIQVAIDNSSDPALIILDECVIQEDTSQSVPAVINFIAMEPASATALDLVKDGKPLAVVVTPEKPTPTESFAVKELCEHMELATGAKLTVVKDGEPVTGPSIHIGNTALARRLGLAPEFLKPDNWLVRRIGQALILSGGDNRDGLNPVSGYLVPFGTLYAVYEFLERELGIRWYWPGELGRVVPKRASVTVSNLCFQGAPTYDTRFAAFMNHPTSEYSRVESRTWWRRLRMGGLGGNPIGNHSFCRWDKKYGKDHPDWFALTHDGSRRISTAAWGYGHLCFTHPDVFPTIVAEKRKYFDDHPWARYSAVMPGDDNKRNACRCEKCQALIRPEGDDQTSHSFAVWSLVNRVATEVRKTHPGRFIVCSSYNDYRDISADVTMEPNVVVSICDSTFPCNMFRPTAKENYVKRMEKLRSRVANLYVWNYWLPRWTAQDTSMAAAPAIYPHAIQEWWMLDRGRVHGHVIELQQFDHDGKDIQAWADWMFDSLNVYVGMRLLWNLDQDVDAMLDEFYREFYGPAGPLLKEFYTKLEAAFLNPNTKGGPDQFRWKWDTCWLSTYPPAFIDEVMGLLRRADRVTKGQEPYHARVQKTLEAYLLFEESSRRFHTALNKPVENVEICPPACKDAPVINAKLDDACWKDAAVASGFVELFNMPELRAKTEIRMVRDAQNLYAAVRVELPSAQFHLTLPENSVDGFAWMQESVELFFVHGVKKHQFLIGPDNVYADAYSPNREKDPEIGEYLNWNCTGVKYKTGRTDKEWTAELAIPIKSLDLPKPTKEDPWRVNFCRNYFYRPEPQKDIWKQELSVWRPTFGPFHNVDRYGVLYFK